MRYIIRCRKHKKTLLLPCFILTCFTLQLIKPLWFGNIKIVWRGAVKQR